MAVSRTKEYKNQKKSQYKIATREGLFIADYIKAKYPQLCTEAAEIYNRINQANPCKPNLLKTTEYREWKNNIARSNNQPASPVPRQRQRQKLNKPFTYPDMAPRQNFTYHDMAPRQNFTYSDMAPRQNFAYPDMASPLITTCNTQNIPLQSINPQQMLYPDMTPLQDPHVITTGNTENTILQPVGPHELDMDNINIALQPPSLQEVDTENIPLQPPSPQEVDTGNIPLQPPSPQEVDTGNIPLPPTSPHQTDNITLQPPSSHQNNTPGPEPTLPSFDKQMVLSIPLLNNKTITGDRTTQQDSPNPTATPPGKQMILTIPLMPIQTPEPIPTEQINTPEPIPTEQINTPEPIPTEQINTPEPIPTEQINTPEPIPTEQILQSAYTETVIEQGQQQQEEQLEPSLFDVIPQDVVDRIVSELQQDPALKDIIEDVEKNINVQEEGIDMYDPFGLEVDVPDIQDPLADQLENMLW